MRLASILLLATLLAAPLAGAQGEGAYAVAPTDLAFGAAVRGEPLHRLLTIQNDKAEPVHVELRATDEAGAWALPEERAFTLPPRTSRDVVLPMVVPADVPNGRYAGSLFVHFSPGASAPPEGASQVRIALAFRVNVTVEVGGPQVEALEAGGLQVPDTEEGAPVVFHWQIKNAGNVRAAPAVTVDVRRPDGTRVASENLTAAALPPGLTQNVTFRLDTTLPRGQHVLSATLASGGGREEAWFDALEPGALRRNGVLGAVAFYDVGTRTETHRIPFGNSVELRAPFTNTGQLPVKAVLRGDVAQGGKIIAEFASEEVLVDPGETVRLRQRLPPLPQPQQYVVTVEVAYSGKVTPPQDAILVLEPATAIRSETPSPAWLAPVAGLVAALALAGRGRRR